MKKQIAKGGGCNIPMIDLTRVLATLANKRQIFHSEADFQHALAWEIHDVYPRCSIRLELRLLHLDNPAYLDILAVSEDVTLAIELKYKTRRLLANVGEEAFYLSDQSAQDTGRYYFLKDIQRLEQFVDKHNRAIGYAIMLTNDSSYWKTSRDSQTVDANFRIHDGKVVTGELRWGVDASKGTMEGREKPITIRNTYTLLWQDYSELSLNEILQGSYRSFRYLLVKVDSKHGGKYR